MINLKLAFSKKVYCSFFFKNAFLLIVIILTFIGNALAQKPEINSSVFDSWPTIRGVEVSITNDGNYALYHIKNVPVGGSTLVIQSTKNKWKLEVPNAAEGQFTMDSKWVIFKAQGDSLCMVELNHKRKICIPNVTSYSLPGKGNGEWLAYQQNGPNQKLIVKSLLTGKERIISDVINYEFNEKGSVLLAQTGQNTGTESLHTLQLLNLSADKLTGIWQGENVAKYTFDSTGKQLAFIAEEKAGAQNVSRIYYYSTSMRKAIIQVDENSLGIDSNLEINNDQVFFCKDCKQIFFTLIEKNKFLEPDPNKSKVDVWSYKDDELQSNQLFESFSRNVFFATINIGENRVIRIGQDGDSMCNYMEGHEFVTMLVSKKNSYDFFYDKKSFPTLYMLSTKDGSRKILKDRVLPYRGAGYDLPPSPDGKWLIYYDKEQNAYFSYEVRSGILRNISKSIPCSLWDDEKDLLVGIEGWLDDGSLLIYDEYDIWKLDPNGLTAPTNITNGYGRKNHIKFRLMSESGRMDKISNRGRLLLTAFNTENKYNGVYAKVPNAKGDPELLSMNPCNQFAVSSQLFGFNHDYQFTPIKARDANIWLVFRESVSVSPNLYATKDFKTYVKLSDVNPEKNFNWLTAELMHWKSPDGKILSGILYKPENFDLKKKYPIIFKYYEKKSDQLFDFIDPEVTGADINIPYFVSRGYLVFTPDIYYKIGHPGDGAVNSVVSAARYLSKFPFIDSTKMGINGHSFGGYETNYLITHSHLFAAAAEASGVSDIISAYSTLWNNDTSMQGYFENGQGRMEGNLWGNQESYIQGSPVFSADKVTTPLLMMHNKGDFGVRWVQGVEFFTALRRLNKRAWMLQYDEGWHGLGGKDALDYTIRLTQFFDHYLKGVPPPKWMTEGIPARMKGIETGYELDTSGKQP